MILIITVSALSIFSVFLIAMSKLWNRRKMNNYVMEDIKTQKNGTFDLEGKTIIITGAAKGLGNQLFWSLKNSKATVIVTGRSEDRLNSVFPSDIKRLRDLKKLNRVSIEKNNNSIRNPSSVIYENPEKAEHCNDYQNRPFKSNDIWYTEDGQHIQVVSAVLDLASLKSVNQFVDLLDDLDITVDFLINNGAYLGPNAQSAENFEMTFATNYLSHYHLTRRLLETGRLSAGSRCINVVSNFYTTIKLDSVHLATLPYKVWGNLEWFEAYKTTKFLLVSLTNALARLYPHVTFLAVHPGEFHTGIMRNIPGVVGKFLRGISYIVFPRAQTGANVIMHTIYDRSLGSHSGAYLDKMKVTPIIPEASNIAFQNSLIDLSEELVTTRQINVPHHTLDF